MYQLLGIPRGASSEDIKKAYKREALRWHPDRNNAPNAELQFKKVSDAYQLLLDKDKRGLYDRYGHDGVRNGGLTSPSSFSDFDDRFSGLHGHHFMGAFDLFQHIFGRDPFAQSFGGPSRDPSASVFEQHQRMMDPFAPGFGSPFGRDPFNRQRTMDPFGGGHLDPFGHHNNMLSMDSFGFANHGFSSFGSAMSGMQGTSTSTQSQYINGVASIVKTSRNAFTDQQGNRIEEEKTIRTDGSGRTEETNRTWINGELRDEQRNQAVPSNVKRRAIRD